MSGLWFYSVDPCPEKAPHFVLPLPCEDATVKISDRSRNVSRRHRRRRVSAESSQPRASSSEKSCGMSKWSFPESVTPSRENHPLSRIKL